MKDRGNLLSLFHFAFCVAAQLAAVSFLAPRCPAQEKKYPPVESLDARAIFRAYCAPCHGLDGKGHGPAASALNSKVADLTLLTKHARGQFPNDRIRTILEGTQTPSAHGSHEMPLWGRSFIRSRPIRIWAACACKILSPTLNLSSANERHLGQLSAPR